MRLLHRFGALDHFGDGEELSLEVHGVGAPAGTQCVDEFIHPRRSFGDRRTGCFVLFGVPALAEPHQKSATRQGVECGEALC